MYQRYGTSWKVATLVSDFLMAAAALYSAHWLKFSSGILDYEVRRSLYPNEALAFLAFSALLILTFKLNHLYRYKMISDGVKQFMRIVLSCVQSFSLLLLYLFLSKSSYIDERIFIGLSFVLIILFVHAGRGILIQALIQLMKKMGAWRKSTLVIGAGEKSKKLVERLSRIRNGYFNVTCTLDPTEGKKPRKNPGEITHYYGLSALDSILANHNVREIIIAIEDEDPEQLITLLRHCQVFGRPINVSSEYFNIIPQRLLIDQFDGNTFARFDHSGRWSRSILKRTIDLLTTLFALVILSPVLLLIALLIKLTSKGPVFYVDTMIGVGEKHFKMYKFRTMKINTSSNRHQEYVSDFIKGKIEKAEVFKITDDDRITGIGRFLRKFSLDELPQLFNIIKGEMSIVGPRPCKKYEYELYEEWHKLRFAIRPGLTGPWQALARSDVPFRGMIALDLFYLFSSSFWLDVELILRTVGVIFSGRGGA